MFITDILKQIVYQVWGFSLTLLVGVYFPGMIIILMSYNGPCFSLQGTWIKVPWSRI